MVVLGRAPDHGAAGRANDLICAALLCLGYVVFYGWLLAKSGGFPYVMDNNESFSSLWHAANLYHFGLERSFGLTDEAYGFAPGAHPYVYTHQGNFPRLFALLLYAAGARSVEAQIVITTFTVGLAALLLAFTFLSRLSASRAFAALACAILFTDYVLVAQWQVVTYRVWHAFFVFAVFLCVDRLERERGPRAWLLLALTGVCLFYFEFVFAAFVAAAAGLYVLLRNPRRPGTVVLAGTALGAGGLLSVLVLCAQIVLYMGWDNFLRDAGYTFAARNQSIDAGAALAALRAFMESNRIVFWYNLFDASGFRNPFHLLTSYTYYELQFHTPQLVLVLALPAAVCAGMALHAGHLASALRWMRGAAVRVLPHAFAAGYFLRRGWRGEFGWVQLASLVLTGALLCFVWRSRGARGRRSPLAGLAVLAGLLPSLAEYLLSAPSALGRLGPYFSAGTLAYLALVAACVDALTPAAAGAPAGTPARQARGAPAALAGLAFLGSTFVVLLLALYSPYGLGARPAGRLFSLAWIAPPDLAYAAAFAAALYLLAVRARSAGGGAWRLAAEDSAVPALRIAIAVNLGAVVVMAANARLYDAHYELLWPEVANFLLPEPLPRLLVVLALLLAHGVAQMGYERLRADPVRAVVLPAALFLAAGCAAYAIVYFLSPGYVFTAYRFRLAPLSVFFTDVMLALGIYLICRLTAAVAAWRGWRAPRRWGAAAGALILLQWTNNQAAYIAFLPPDRLGILKTLAQPPYKGASFVSNTYAAPFAAFTGQWAYIDQELGMATVEERGGVRRLKTDDRYLWLADRGRNPAYRRPQYFICLTPHSLTAVVEQLRYARGEGPDYPGCGGMELVRRAIAGRTDALPRARLIATDTEGLRRNGYESWAILGLDWGP